MDSPHGAAVTAEDFGLKGPRGWAFRGVRLDAPPGALVAIEGPSGSGRTCLLLALTGRMRASEGRAEVGGLRLPRHMAAVRRISALGPVPGVSELDPAFTVAEHLHERALLQRRFDGSLRTLLRPRAERAATSRARIDAALDAAGLIPADLPKAERTSVRDLERLEALRLSVALALVGRPRLLAVDDADLKLSDNERAEAWELLRSVAAGGTTVLAVCSQAPEDAITVRTDGKGGAEGTRAGNATGTADAAHAATAEASEAPAARRTTGTTTEKTTTEKGTADAIAETGRA
ncbi:ATP-binding cassette domain-containing protein [Streptomyces sp. NPDC005318]|uniref:ATP-binding cassette domain-containing protein n=1 Tax=Streptomyces sp. NPDC005318 TaxID=3157031 RepID=UPI0033A7D5B9